MFGHQFSKQMAVIINPSILLSLRILLLLMRHCLRSTGILVPRGRAPFGQHQESRPLARSNNGSPRFTDLPSLCACSESSLTNLIGSGLNLLCLQIHQPLHLIERVVRKQSFPAEPGKDERIGHLFQSCFSAISPCYYGRRPDRGYREG